MPFRLAHYLLASKFLRPKAPSYFTESQDPSGRRTSGWTAALGETPSSAIKHLLEQGYFVRCGDLTGPELSAAIDTSCTVAEIRPLLQTHQLRTSGRKAELIERLAQEFPETLRSVLRDRGLVQCSGAGRLFAQQWTDRVATLLADVRGDLERKAFGEAAERSIAFDDELGFPKWEFEGRPEGAQLARIAQANPAILRGVPPAVLENLRFTTELCYVCGRYYTPPSGESVEGSPLPSDAAVRMVLFSANWQRSMEQFRLAGITHVEHFAVVEDPNTCETCKQLHGRKWPVGEAPELPHPGCMNSILGCRCLYSPVF
jgi:hypothetical protein